MHRDIRGEIQAFPHSNRIAEQRALDRWRQEFNQIRPHEALAGKTPAEIYRRGERRSLRQPSWRYPAGWIVKRAFGPNGRVCVHGEEIALGRPFIAHVIGFEPRGERKAHAWLNDVE